MRWALGSASRASRRAAQLAARPTTSAGSTSWSIGGATGCRFVSKDDLGQPAGPLARRPERTPSTSAARPRERRQGPGDWRWPRRSSATSRWRCSPKARSAPGTHLLPFRSTLLEAANYAAAGRRAAARSRIDYGAAAPEIAWYQEPVIQNARRVLGRKGRLPVDASACSSRSTVAATASSSPRPRAPQSPHALGFPLDEPSPIGAGE